MASNKDTMGAVTPTPEWEAEGPPVAWLHYDPNAIEGAFPWVLMVNQDHPLIQAKTDRIVLHASGVMASDGSKPE